MSRLPTLRTRNPKGRLYVRTLYVCLRMKRCNNNTTYMRMVASAPNSISVFPHSDGHSVEEYSPVVVHSPVEERHLPTPPTPRTIPYGTEHGTLDTPPIHNAVSARRCIPNTPRVHTRLHRN